MTAPEIIFACVVVLVGLPSAWRNVTAAALVASWAAGQAVWLFSGDSLPLRFYMMADLAVLAVIFCKPTPYSPYRGFGHQLCLMWLERSLWDRVVITIFGLMWLTYSLPISDYYRW